LPSASKLFEMAQRVDFFPRLLRLVPTVAVIGLLFTACSRAGGTSPAATDPSVLGPGRGYGGTVTVGPQDAGKSITLGAGDILVFAVSNASPSAGAMTWHLMSYPRDIITLISQSSTPPFRFRALYQGTGVLRLTLGPIGCGGPGPLAASSKECPVMGSSAAEGPPGMAARLLIFPVRVLGRG
jgi:hypothetical protein